MRVLDPYEDRFDPERDWRDLNRSKKRGRKKVKPRRRTDYFFKVRCRVPTEEPDERDRYVDDWAPNLPGPDGVLNEVEVTVLGWREHYYVDATQPAYRVCVWGGDDLGYERDFHFTEVDDVTWLVELVLNFPEPLTKDYLIDVVGMWPA